MRLNKLVDITVNTVFNIIEIEFLENKGLHKIHIELDDFNSELNILFTPKELTNFQTCINEYILKQLNKFHGVDIIEPK